MSSIGNFLLATLFAVVALWFCYRILTILPVYYSLSTTDMEASGPLTAGQIVTISGTVHVDEPAPDSNQIFEEVDDPIALYIWRARFETTSNRIDLRGKTIQPDRSTFESGIETGTFTVQEGAIEVCVDPSWLVESHDGSNLSEITVGGLSRHRKFHTYLWESDYIQLSNLRSECAFDKLGRGIDKHNATVNLDDYILEAKAVSDGDRITVRGVVEMKDGMPVIRGADKTALYLAENGFDSLRHKLRLRIGKSVLVITACSILIWLSVFL